MKLYRGENIINGSTDRVTALKKFIHLGLPSDFINGGNPYRFQQLGFLDGTVMHVIDNNLGDGVEGQKHFISFSEDKKQAEFYATQYMDTFSSFKKNDYDLSEKSYCYDGGAINNDWVGVQHLLIELDISDAEDAHQTAPFLKIIKINKGENRIVALNVVQYLETELKRLSGVSRALLLKYPDVIPSIEKAINYARSDLEWLVASLDLMPLQLGVLPSLSGIVPHSEILKIGSYKQ